MPFIETLLELGADPNYDHDDGFPSLIAALSTDRDDRYALVQLLLLTVQQIHLLHEEFTRLHQAMRARAFRAAIPFSLC